MDEKDEEAQSIINHDIKSNQPSIESETDKSQSNPSFSITPKELSNLMNLYKDRSDNYNDIKYFKEKGGILPLLTSLKTDAKDGISTLSLENRLEHFGSNKIFVKPLPNFMDFVYEALSDKMIIILIISSLIEISISLFNKFFKGENNIDYLDGISIIIAIVVVVMVGSITNYKKEMKFHSLNDFEKKNAKYNVIRNGMNQYVISDELLVGDLIKINYGEILPADMILIEGNGLKIDESSLTGESNSVSKKCYEDCLEELLNKKKEPSSNLLFCGTNVVEGNGSAIVVAIGEYSQKGIIKGTIDNAQEENKTPLENKLNIIADLIGYFGLGSAIITFIALCIQLTIEYFTNKELKTIEIVNKILKILILCVSIIVVAIPEGLPLAVTLSLAFSIKKLMDRNNLVRKMHACETMGGANYICTDKTGTLTENQMYIVSLITHNKEINIKRNIDSIYVGTINSTPIDKNYGKKIRNNYNLIIDNENVWEITQMAISVNVECEITPLIKSDINGDMETCTSKNKTDKAFTEFLYQFKSPVSYYRNKFLTNNYNFKKLPFDSIKKRMSIMIKNSSFPTGYRLFTKGAAENAMIYSDKYIDKENGQIYEINNDIKKYINHKIDKLNKKMIRSLYVCYKDISKEEFDNGFDIGERGLLIDQLELVFIGIFGLKDSLRQEVKESVDKCHNASVNVIMVTGDNIITATSIAKECNILPKTVDLNNLKKYEIEKNPYEINNPELKQKHIESLLINQPYSITGNSFYEAIGGIYCETCNEDSQNCKCPKTKAEAEELSKKNGEEIKKIKKDSIKNIENFKKITKNLLVLARSQPLHKYALVLGLKALGNVVAVTGDGTNDAPALSKSDVGFAMIEGTDIAKEASDIVILDNNFSSIVIAIIYGRSIYENIRKFLQFQLTVNFCACILVFICSCIGNETPLNSIQMLWVNLIMDSLGSLALATEPPYDSLLQKRPTRKDESIINGIMWKNISLQALFEIFLLLILYIKGPSFIREDKKIILKSHEEIYKCFGGLPGDVNYEKSKDYIIFGSENSWNKKLFLNLTGIKADNTLKEICKKFLPNNEDDWSNISLFDVFDKYNDIYGSTTHMTFIFNVFVFYTLFNQINCRVIDNSYNIFARIDKGLMFCLVTFGEMFIQFLIVQYGYGVFHCVKGGLSFTQWTLCIIISSSTFLFGIIIKMIPLDKIIDYYLASKDDKDVFRPIPTIGFSKGISIIVNNVNSLISGDSGDKYNNNYSKIVKDEDSKDFQESETVGIYEYRN